MTISNFTTAAYVAWVEREMQTFVAMFSRQVFPQGSVVGHGVAGECVAIALNNAQQVSLVEIVIIIV